MEGNNLTIFMEIYEIYIMYFDELKGNIPLLIYPDESIKRNSKKMRPIKYHPIWFLDTNIQNEFDHVDLIYNRKVYLARKFQTISKRKKRREGFKTETPELIVIIIALPSDLYNYGENLLNNLSELIITNFDKELYQIIESEIAKDELIKTAKLGGIINKGNSKKKEIKDLIDFISKEYFLSIIK